MGEVENKIISIVGNNSYLDALKINDDNVLPIKTLTILGSDKIIKYNVKEENTIYNVQFVLKNDEIISATCTCEKEQKCKHIAKVLMAKKDEFFPKIINNSNKLLKEISSSNSILDKMYDMIKKNKKKVLKLEIELQFIKRLYSKNGLIVSFKMGENKLYSLNNRVISFFDAYTSKKGSVIFGKEFIYEPQNYYFNEIDTQILNFCSYIYNGSTEIYIPMNYGASFFKLLNGKHYVIEPGYECFGIMYDNPYLFNLEKQNNLYKFSINYENKYDYKYLDMDKKYCYHEHNLYEIPEVIRKFVDELEKSDKKEIFFEASKINVFYALFSNYFNKSIMISESIKDEFEIIIPKVYLYFDLDKDIICNVSFLYKDISINYFDNTSTILRNNLYEEEVISEIKQYGFMINTNYFELDDEENYGIFLEEGLNILSQKYHVFTTEKFNNNCIMKEFEVSSHFSIGKDNIFKCEFNMDEECKKELINIMDAYNEQKKYYRFKSGKILKLDNKTLNDFKELTQELNLNINNLENTKEYVLPKFRALYIDSLRNNNDLIKTNNVFDEFVSNFKKVHTDINFTDNVLRSYQELGTKWLYNIYKYGFGGILADEMGLGKSIQIIYFIKEILKENNNYKILIVSPTALVYNWENEFKKFGNTLKYMVICGSKEKRKELFAKFDDYNIFITTYGLIKEDKEFYLEKNFEVLIIDEAQMIKNPKTDITRTLKQINVNTKMALTGTPIENSLIEIWSIFDFIMPGYLNTLNKFNEKYNINNIEEEKEKLNYLNKQISPFILRRKKSEVLKDLPEKLENNIYLELNDKQKVFYKASLEQTKKEMDEIIKTEGFLKARFKILSLITKLRQICIDPKIVDEKYSGGSIKMDEVCVAIERLILDNHKILVFTSYRSALEILKQRLDNLNISNYVIDGSVSSKKRQELVTNFNENQTNVFLIMLRAGGTGLNLTGADVVIHLDLWWNPQVEAQANDRAHRIGQKNMVEVIKFICKGTIEEKILELQEKKKELSDILIEGNERSNDLVSNLTEEEFKKLLAYSE